MASVYAFLFSRRYAQACVRRVCMALTETRTPYAHTHEYMDIYGGMGAPGVLTAPAQATPEGHRVFSKFSRSFLEVWAEPSPPPLIPAACPCPCLPLPLIAPCDPHPGPHDREIPGATIQLHAMNCLTVDWHHNDPPRIHRERMLRILLHPPPSIRCGCCKATP